MKTKTKSKKVQMLLVTSVLLMNIAPSFGQSAQAEIARRVKEHRQMLHDKPSYKKCAERADETTMWSLSNSSYERKMALCERIANEDVLFDLQIQRDVLNRKNREEEELKKKKRAQAHELKDRLIAEKSFVGYNKSYVECLKKEADAEYTTDFERSFYQKCREDQILADQRLTEEEFKYDPLFNECNKTATKERYQPATDVVTTIKNFERSYVSCKTAAIKRRENGPTEACMAQAKILNDHYDDVSKKSTRAIGGHIANLKKQLQSVPSIVRLVVETSPELAAIELAKLNKKGRYASKFSSTIPLLSLTTWLNKKKISIDIPVTASLENDLSALDKAVQKEIGLEPWEVGFFAKTKGCALITQAEVKAHYKNKNSVGESKKKVAGIYTGELGKTGGNSLGSNTAKKQTSSVTRN